MAITVFIIDTDNMDINSIASGFLRLNGLRKFFLAQMFINSTEEIKDIEREILEKIHDCSESPVVNLTVHDSSRSFTQLIDMTKDLKSQCLICHFNYIDESEQLDHSELTQKAKDLTPRELLKIALNPMDDEAAQLGIDLFDSLKREEDVSGLLEDFKNKRYTKEKMQDEIDKNNFNKWVKEFESWANS